MSELKHSLLLCMSCIYKAINLFEEAMDNSLWDNLHSVSDFMLVDCLMRLYIYTYICLRLYVFLLTHLLACIVKAFLHVHV